MTSNAAYYQKNKEKENARSRAYYRKNRADQIAKAIARNVVRQYGITLVDRDAMADRQDGKCAICQNVTKLYIDHDHDSGKVRALLCDSCNKGVGMFRDDPEIMSRAAQYVYFHRPLVANV